MKKKLDRRIVRRFLDALVETRNVRDAAQAANVSVMTLYRHRKKDPAFRVAWEDALDRADLVLREEAMRRVMEGYEQPVFYKGEKVATVRRYNDSLLINLLRLEIVRRRYREEKRAVREGEKTDELAEILELIDGKTRGIRQE